MKLSEIKKLMNALPPENMDWQAKKGQELLQKLGFEPSAMYQELEMESRFVDTHQDVSFSATKVNLHSHSFYELLFCRNTCGVEYLVGFSDYSSFYRAFKQEYGISPRQYKKLQESPESGL